MHEKMLAERAKMEAKSLEAFRRITSKLSSIDGIATSDAVELGMLIRDYADCRAGLAMGDLLGPIFSRLLDDPAAPKEPWKGGDTPR